MRTIAVFFPNWVGDAVMATPAVRALAERFPAARLLAVGRPFLPDLLAGTPWIADYRLSAREKGFELVAPLRRDRIDLAVLFPNSYRSAFIAALASCRRRVGFHRTGREWLLTEVLHPVRDARGRRTPRPVLDDYNRLVAQVGAVPDRRLELFTTPADEARADAVFARLPARVIALNVGGAFGAAKHWPSAHAVELAQRLVDEHDTGVLVLCGPAERDVARQIATAAQRPQVQSLADAELSLGLSKACVRRATALVTTDSGPRHFAHALGRPVVTLFGPTHIAWTETYHALAIHLQKDLPCGPCQQRACPLGHHECMTTLRPAEVLTALHQLTARRSHAA
jgi:heptosyltransferase-2